MVTLWRVTGFTSSQRPQIIWMDFISKNQKKQKIFLFHFVFFAFKGWLTLAGGSIRHGQTTCLRSKTLPDAEWRSVIRRPLLSNNPPPLLLLFLLPPPLPPLPPPKPQPPTPPTFSAHLLRLFAFGTEMRRVPQLQPPLKNTFRSLLSASFSVPALNIRNYRSVGNFFSNLGTLWRFVFICINYFLQL